MIIRVFVSTSQSLQEIKRPFCVSKVRKKESMIKIAVLFFFPCWTMIENQRGEKERCATRSSNTKHHDRKVHLELSNDALLLSLFENTVL